MISLKVQKENGVSYLLGLEESDLSDLSNKDAVITVTIGDAKVSLTKVSGTKEQFIEHVKTLGGLKDESLIIKP